MAFRLAADGFPDRFVEAVNTMFTQGMRQIGIVILSKTHIEHAGTGQADTVAAFAEIMCQRRDETQLAAGLTNLDIACGPPLE